MSILGHDKIFVTFDRLKCHKSFFGDETLVVALGISLVHVFQHKKSVNIINFPRE